MANLFLAKKLEIKRTYYLVRPKLDLKETDVLPINGNWNNAQFMDVDV